MYLKHKMMSSILNNDFPTVQQSTVWAWDHHLQELKF